MIINEEWMTITSTTVWPHVGKLTLNYLKSFHQSFALMSGSLSLSKANSSTSCSPSRLPAKVDRVMRWQRWVMRVSLRGPRHPARLQKPRRRPACMPKKKDEHRQTYLDVLNASTEWICTKLCSLLTQKTLHRLARVRIYACVTKTSIPGELSSEAYLSSIGGCST